jgi:putative FmdB family regulatory protein
MPTYGYECLKCGHHFDRFQRITEPPVKRCPKCRGKVRRQIGTGSGILFKGSGFYITDYRSDSYRQGAKADVSAASPAKAEKSAASPAKSSSSNASSKKPESSSSKKE